MKLRNLYIWTLLATLFFVACTPEADIIDDLPQNNGENTISSIKVIARDFKGGENLSRTSVEITNEGASFTWAENDTIGIFPTNSYQTAFPMVSGAGSKTAEFDGGDWALKASSSYAAYYPFEFNNRSGKNVSVSFMGQYQKGNDTTDHLGKFDYMAAAATTPSSGSVSFEFQHLAALVQWRLKVPEAGNYTALTLENKEHVFIRNGKVDLTKATPVIESSDKATNVSMELTEVKAQTAGEEITVYMMMAPVDLTGKTFTVSLSNDKGEVATAELTGQKFEAGTAYAVSAELGALEEATLQIADYRGKAINLEGGQIQLEYLSNRECTYVISDNAKDWLLVTDTRAVTQRSLTVMVTKNDTDANRRGTVTIKSLQSNLAVEYAIVQGTEGTYAITKSDQPLPVGILYAGSTPTDSKNGLANLVDGNLDTYFEVSGSNFDLMWEGAYSTPVCTFELGICGGNYQIGNIWFHTSEDGKSWNGLSWGIGYGMANGNHLYVINEKARSRYIKLEVKSNHGGSTTRLSEFGMKEDMEADKDLTTFAELIARGTSFTKNETTPMGNHYADKHVTTDTDRAWLADAKNEPDLLGSASGYTLRPYTVNLYPYEHPVPADVNQLGIGDCSALAVFAEMAYLFPDFIESIITDHGDGTFTVAMFDPQGKPVNVTVQSTFLGDDNGIGATRGKDGKPNWATVMEKAIMKWNKIYQVNPDISGIGSEHVAPLFTGEGNSFAISPNSLLAEQLDQAVDLALNERMIVIGGFNKGDLSVNGPKTVTAHAFSFMLSNDPTAMFAMRNPWGNSPGGKNGDDGILNIVNDDIVPPTIDLRIIYPGIAADYAKETLSPYIPPQW
ncbi:MAG: fimbrillin family protein [Bacteroides sp.]|nr:fimbrillin family protein [Bacteroides sp.]